MNLINTNIRETRMRDYFGKVVLLLFTVVVLAVTPALAQMTTGSVSGTVADQTGAVIPGATVTLTNDATGVTREVQTNQVGTFVIDRVRPGTYTIRHKLSLHDALVAISSHCVTIRVV